MEFELGKKHPAKVHGKSLAKYLREMLSENDKASGRPLRALMAERAIELALDPKTDPRIFWMLFDGFMDREDGKPVNTNLNAEVSANPFDGIDTAKIEALKARLEEIQKK